MNKKHIFIFLTVILTYITLTIDFNENIYMSVNDKALSEFDLNLRELGVREVPCIVTIEDKNITISNYKDNEIKSVPINETQSEILLNSKIKEVSSDKEISIKELPQPVALEIFMATCEDCKALSKQDIKEKRNLKNGYNFFRYYIKSTKDEIKKI